jgi:hypothetical protein
VCALLCRCCMTHTPRVGPYREVSQPLQALAALAAADSEVATLLQAAGDNNSSTHTCVTAAAAAVE